MGKYFICCERCFQDIAFHNTSAAKFWMDLCNLRLKRGEYVILMGQDNDELQILEHAGFIITSDMPHHVMIRIMCHMQTVNGEDFFCAKKGRHD